MLRCRYSLTPAIAVDQFQWHGPCPDELLRHLERLTEDSRYHYGKWGCGIGPWFRHQAKGSILNRRPEQEGHLTLLSLSGPGPFEHGSLHAQLASVFDLSGVDPARIIPPFLLKWLESSNQVDITIYQDGMYHFDGQRLERICLYPPVSRKYKHPLNLVLSLFQEPNGPTYRRLTDLIPVPDRCSSCGHFLCSCPVTTLDHDAQVSGTVALIRDTETHLSTLLVAFDDMTNEMITADDPIIKLSQLCLAGTNNIHPTTINLIGGVQAKWFGLLPLLSHHGVNATDLLVFMTEASQVPLTLRFGNLLCWDMTQFLNRPICQLLELSPSSSPNPAHRLNTLSHLILDELMAIMGLFIPGVSRREMITLGAIGPIARICWMTTATEPIGPADLHCPNPLTDPRITRFLVGVINQKPCPDYPGVDVDPTIYLQTMVKYRYPVGEPKMTTREVPGKMGIYRCVIGVNSYLGHDHPWTKDPCIITSVDINRLRHHGCLVLIKNGIYWDEDRPLFKTFALILRRYESRASSLGRTLIHDFVMGLLREFLLVHIGMKWGTVKTPEQLLLFLQHHSNVQIQSEQEGLVVGGYPRMAPSRPYHLRAFIEAYNRQDTL